eukprot:4956-Heterococcus_DN1.PRE.2
MQSTTADGCNNCDRARSALLVFIDAVVSCHSVHGLTSAVCATATTATTATNAACYCHVASDMKVHVLNANSPIASSTTSLPNCTLDDCLY